ncbi:polyprenyl synthetase family protein [Streptomyces sp. NPDC052225]|uniref:polyprenyl synthetase family protein n=1 Tax=Streptomyces sp. NPDC052225 TaxID=3154949 RepID=UPI00344A1A41
MPPDEAAGATATAAPPDGADRGADMARSYGAHQVRSVRVRQIDADVAQAVEHRLAPLLAHRVAQATTVNATFGADVAGRVARFTLDGGRRLRPQFLWWGLRACGLPDEPQVDAALQLSAALELIQTCALVHDDLMDAAATRRGHPAVHADFAAQYAGSAPEGGAPFGVSAAILAGDLALAWADDEAAALDLPGHQLRRIRETWSQMRLEMVAGQYLDIQGEHTRTRSLSHAVRAACLKTALYTVERPLHLGALLGNADDTTVRALCSSGRGAGLAFQLRDDLEDAFGDADRRGKPAAGDLRAGKPTYLVALAHTQAERDGDRHALHVLDTCLGRPDLDDAGLDEIRHVLERTGARQAVEEKIRRLIGQSMRHLNAVPLDPVAHARLRLLLQRAAGSTTVPTPLTASARPTATSAAQGAAR